ARAGALAPVRLADGGGWALIRIVEVPAAHRAHRPGLLEHELAAPGARYGLRLLLSLEQAHGGPPLGGRPTMTARPRAGHGVSNPFYARRASPRSPRAAIAGAPVPAAGAFGHPCRVTAATRPSSAPRPLP